MRVRDKDLFFMHENCFAWKKLHQWSCNQEKEAQYGEPSIYFDVQAIYICITRFKDPASSGI